jgi:hypothetical protein
MVLSRNKVGVYFGEKYKRPHESSISIIAAPSYNHNQSVSKTGLMMYLRQNHHYFDFVVLSFLVLIEFESIVLNFVFALIYLCIFFQQVITLGAYRSKAKICRHERHIRHPFDRIFTTFIMALSSNNFGIQSFT